MIITGPGGPSWAYSSLSMGLYEPHSIATPSRHSLPSASASRPSRPPGGCCGAGAGGAACCAGAASRAACGASCGAAAEPAAGGASSATAAAALATSARGGTAATGPLRCRRCAAFRARPRLAAPRVLGGGRCCAAAAAGAARAGGAGGSVCLALQAAARAILWAAAVAWIGGAPLQAPSGSRRSAQGASRGDAGQPPGGAVELQQGLGDRMAGLQGSRARNFSSRLHLGRGPCWSPNQPSRLPLPLSSGLCGAWRAFYQGEGDRGASGAPGPCSAAAWRRAAGPGGHAVASRGCQMPQNAARASIEHMQQWQRGGGARRAAGPPQAVRHVTGSGMELEGAAAGAGGRPVAGRRRSAPQGGTLQHCSCSGLQSHAAAGMAGSCASCPDGR